MIMMPILHEIDEPRVYCGPAALMAITGKRLPIVRSAINKARGFADNRGVIGLHNEHLELAMTLLGVNFIKEEPENKPMLSDLISQLRVDTRYIITVTGHYITYLNGIVVDNHTRFGTPINECKWIRKKVKNYYMLDFA